jgi:D-alanyl-D-alanine carboxypeptidase
MILQRATMAIRLKSKKTVLVLAAGIFLVGGWGVPAARAVESYIIADQQTGHIFASRNRDQRRQVASLTKVALGVVILDAAEIKLISLAEQVRIPAEAMRAGGANPAGLQEGDVVSLRDLLYCALMSSDNVAATALAHHVGRRLPNPTRLDPVGNFVAHMNALARNLRMRRTLFLNPHGIDSMQGTLPVSTALDMARLTRYAYTDGDFRFFVSQRTREIDVLREGQRMSVTLRNTNQLLGQDGIDGVKTGFTNRAGYCLIVSSWKNPEVIRRGDSVVQNQRRLIVVVLGAHTNEARFSEGLRFIRTGWSLYDQWARAGRVVNKKDTL